MREQTLVPPPEVPPPPPRRDGGATRSAGALWLAILLPLVLVGALHELSRHFGAAPSAEVLQLTEATRVDSASLEPPAGPGSAAVLPVFIPRDPSAAPGPMWFLVPFELPRAAASPYELGVSFRPTMLVYLDGLLLAQSAPGESLDRGNRSFQLGSRALQVQVPPSLLRAGRHELQLRIGSAGYDGAALSGIRIGPSDAMEALRASRTLLTWARGGIAAAAAVLGIFLVVAWIALRQEWLYGLAGVHCLLIALLLSPTLMADAPLPAPWWRMLLDCADVAAKGLLLVLVLRLFEATPARVTWWILAYVILGAGIDAAAAWNDVAWTDFGHPWPWWALGSRAVVLAAATALVCHAVWRDGSRRRVLAAVVVGLGAWLWLYVSLFVIVIDLPAGVVDLNFVGYGAWVFLIGSLLQRRYVASLRQQQRTTEELAGLVEERTAQLEANFAALRESERLRMAAAERERLLQEMHDGLGSQLVAAKVGAQRGTLSKEDVVQVFEDCIQEMRFTVDALSVDDGDLALLLANLRHRLGARLRDAGLELEWSVGDTPLVPALSGAGGRELARIVQEALNNVIQHAHASRIRITTRFENPGTVMLGIADNGVGLPPGHSEGRGMGNIRARAARLGARVEWFDHGRVGQEGRGTELRLYLPVASAVAPGAALG